MCLGPEIALVASLVGAATTAVGTYSSIQQGKKASKASQRAEALRAQQMRLEQMQKRRQAIRDFQQRRAVAMSNISGQTGSLEGSAAGGVSSAYSASLGTNIGELSQAGAIGEGIFAANAAYSEASAGAQTGSAIAGFGKDLFAAAQPIGRIGSTLFNGQSNG